MKKINWNRIKGLRFISGAGNPTDHTVCLMSAARILAGEATADDNRDDNCTQVCNVVRAFGINANDWRGWKDDEERAEYMRPLAAVVLGTATTDRKVWQKRAFIAADAAVRVFAPIALEAAKLPEEAIALRALAPIVDEATAIVGRDRAWVARKKAWDRYDAARAAADARAADAARAAADARAADAARAAAARAADAARAAAARAAASLAARAADAAADAADARAEYETRRVLIRDALVATLRAMCEVES